MKNFKKLLSVTLALVMVLALLPISAGAAVEFSVDNNNVLTKYNGSGGHVVIPDGVTAIGTSAFEGRTDITSVTTPASVTRIDYRAFFNCDALTDVSIPNSVTIIAGEAFADCESLKSIVIPASVNEVGGRAFDNCTALESVVIEGALNGKTIIDHSGIFSDCINLSSVTIKEGMTEIYSVMFFNCPKLTSITLPDSVNKIGIWAFGACTALETVDLGDGLQRVWDGAFSSCTALKEIILPATFARADTYAFSGSIYGGIDLPENITRLESVTFADGTETIANFRADSSLAKVYVPASVTSVEDGAFDAYSDLTVYGVKGSYIDSYCSLCGIPFVNIFADVPVATYYTKPVFWAVDEGITTGTDADHFSPSDTCTVAQILTFLYRAKGSPAPTIDNPFTDVKSGDYYYNAALWAFENGLVSGSEFGPATPCTRAMVVTYLWKLDGSPKASGSKFADVSADADYAQAVYWAVDKGITSGTSDSAFSPSDTCTRAQIVTFLYRAYR